jgi:hypothetical protein
MTLLLSRLFWMIVIPAYIVISIWLDQLGVLKFVAQEFIGPLLPPEKQGEAYMFLIWLLGMLFLWMGPGFIMGSKKK